MWRAEARRATVDGGFGGPGGGKAEARVGLLTASGRFIENRAVNFGDYNIVASGEVERRIGALGEGIEF